MKPEESIKQALRSADPYQHLRAVVQSLFADGKNQESVLALLEGVRKSVREEGKESDEDVILDVMDCVVGWCGSHAMLSPTNPSEKD